MSNEFNLILCSFVFLFFLNVGNVGANPFVRTLDQGVWFNDGIGDCPLRYQDEATFMSMDRLCETCHDMYRYQDPDVRVNCR